MNCRRKSENCIWRICEPQTVGVLEMNIQRIAAAVEALSEDETIYTRMSKKDLAIVQAVLIAVASWCHKELQKRDKAA